MDRSSTSFQKKWINFTYKLQWLAPLLKSLILHFLLIAQKKTHANRCNSYRSLKLINATLDLMIFIGIPQPVGRSLCFTIRMSSKLISWKASLYETPGDFSGTSYFFCTLPEGLTAVRCLKIGEGQFQVSGISNKDLHNQRPPYQVSQVGPFCRYNPYIPIDHRTPAQGKKITLQ